MSVLKQLLSFAKFVWQAARWQLVGAILLSTALSFTEGISIALVFPLLAVMGDPNHIAQARGRYTTILFHLLSVSHIPPSGWLGSLLVLLLIAIAGLTQLNGVLIAVTMSVMLRVRRTLALKLYRGMLHADWMFLTRQRTSDISHLLNSEMNRVVQVTGSSTNLFSNLIIGLFMLSVALYLAPWLTLIVIVCLGIALPFQRRSSRSVLRSGQRLSTRTAEVFASSMERVQQLKVVKAFGAQDAELRLFTRRYANLLLEIEQNAWARTAASRWFQIYTLVLLCGVVLLGLNGLHLSAAAILIFLFAFIRAVPRINGIQSNVNEILSDLPGYTEIANFLTLCQQNSEDTAAATPLPQLTRAVNIANITFAYTPDGPAILNGLSITLRAGQITAIAGSSGAGKSTTADIVMGMIFPQSGTLSADGIVIDRSNASAWRKQVGYVSQDTLLFHDNIRETLLWAKPDATSDELAEALEAARAQFVYTLPHGLETIVGDRGTLLSHGQRQRLALARALLIKPSLLILDEATNSLDLDNEESILRAVATSSRSMTTLLISHRPSALMAAETIYFLENGRVQSQGTFTELQTRIEAAAADVSASENTGLA
jgi:ATP-binding cassette subfamily C protein